MLMWWVSQSSKTVQYLLPTVSFFPYLALLGDGLHGTIPFLLVLIVFSTLWKLQWGDSGVQYIPLRSVYFALLCLIRQSTWGDSNCKLWLPGIGSDSVHSFYLELGCVEPALKMCGSGSSQKFGTSSLWFFLSRFSLPILSGRSCPDSVL